MGVKRFRRTADGHQQLYGIDSNSPWFIQLSPSRYSPLAHPCAWCACGGFGGRACAAAVASSAARAPAARAITWCARGG